MTDNEPNRARNLRDWAMPIVLLLVFLVCAFLLFRRGFIQVFPG